MRKCNQNGCWMMVPLAVLLAGALGTANADTFRGAQFYALPGTSLTFYVPMMALADVGSPAGPPDGLLDVIAVNQDGIVAVLFGNRDQGCGLYCTGINTSLGTVPTAFAAADFDHDGFVDLVVTDNSNKLTFYQGSSDGPPFTKKGDPIAVGTAPRAILAADVNGDGKMDAIVVNNGQVGSGVTILLGKNDGTFQSAGLFSAGVLPSGAAVGDFDKDGKLDIAVVNNGSNSVTILRGAGNGTFSLKQTVNNVGSGPTDIAAQDLNGDGLLDLVVVDSLQDKVSVLDGQAGGTFKAPRMFPSGTMNSAPNALALGDVNHDGHPDIVVSNNFSNDVGVLLGDGHGNFAAPRSFVADQEPLAVAVSDVDGDGLTDLVTLNKGVQAPDAAVLLALPDGGFTAVEDVPTQESPITVIAADVDNDGLADLIVGDSNGQLRVFYAKSGGGFTAPAMLQSAGDGFAIARGDFNRDGRIDLVAVNKCETNDASCTNQVSLFLAGAKGLPSTPTQNRTIGAGPFAVAVGDWNEDGRPDLAIPRQGSGTNGAVDILLTTPSGTLGAPTSLTVGSNPVAIDVGDFNKDGHRDLAVANSGSSTMSILLGNGNGTFQPATTIQNLRNIRGLVVADFDHDGRDDIAAILPMDGAVEVLYGQPQGFMVGASLTVGGTPSGLAARDLDGDGVADLVAADQVSNSVYSFLSRPGRQFAGDSGVFVGRGPASIVSSAVAAADFDGDGRYDAATVDNFLAGTAPVMSNVLAPTVLRGDGNGDGAVTAADTIAVLLAAHNTNGIRVEDLPTDAYAATRGVDANGDGSVNAQDALAVAHRLFMGS